MLPETPEEINENISKLLDRLKLKSEPVIVPVILEPNAKLENCFINVQEKVKNYGGKIIYGWALYQSTIICEAIRHAVWKSPDGNLVDITTTNFGFKKTMFIDDDLEYYGQLIDSVRLNITGEKIIDDFIKICEAYEYFHTLSERESEGVILVAPKVAQLIDQYVKLKEFIQTYINAKGIKNLICFCGSSKIYDDCHGKIIRLNIPKDIALAQRS